MTQKDFAAAIGADPKAYSQWEAGNNNPRNLVDVCQEVERVTGVSAAWLLGLNVPAPGDGNGVFQAGNGHSAGLEENAPFLLALVA